MHWNDVMYFVAAAREGSFSRAGRALEVEHTTVARRVSALEKELGSRLLDRTPAGLTLTPAGREVLARAAEAEAQMTGIERLAGTFDSGASGEVVLATSTLLAEGFVVRALGALRQAHPRIALRVAVARQLASLPRREADVALRLRPSGATVAEPDVVATRLGEARFGLYASRAYVESHPPLGSRAEQQRVIRYGASPWEPGRAWVEAHLARAAVAFSVDDMPTVRAACMAGLGLAVLPAFSAADTSLRLLAEGCDKAGLFLAVHPDLRRVERVAAVAKWLSDAVKGRLSEVRRARR